MVLKRADARDALVVAVVVNKRYARLLGGGSDEQVHRGDAAMIAVS